MTRSVTGELSWARTSRIGSPTTRQPAPSAVQGVGWEPCSGACERASVRVCERLGGRGGHKHASTAVLANAAGEGRRQPASTDEGRDARSLDAASCMLILRAVKCSLQSLGRGRGRRSDRRTQRQSVTSGVAYVMARTRMISLREIRPSRAWMGPPARDSGPRRPALHGTLCNAVMRCNAIAVPSLVLAPQRAHHRGHAPRRPSADCLGVAVGTRGTSLAHGAVPQPCFLRWLRPWPPPAATC